MKKMMVGLGSAVACLAMIGCQTAGPRGGLASSGKGWNTSAAKPNSSIGTPQPIAKSQWPTGPANPSFGAPTPVNPATPASFQQQAPAASLQPPTNVNSFHNPPALPPGPPNSGFNQPGLELPPPQLPNNAVNNSFHQQPPAPPPLGGLPPAPPALNP